MTKSFGIPIPSEVVQDNIQAITEDQLQGELKAEYDAHMVEYKKLCLASFGCTRDKVIKKAPVPGPREVTFIAVSGKVQDMMDQAMNRSLINQSKVLENSM